MAWTNCYKVIPISFFIIEFSGFILASGKYIFLLCSLWRSCVQILASVIHLLVIYKWKWLSPTLLPHLLAIAGEGKNHSSHYGHGDDNSRIYNKRDAILTMEIFFKRNYFYSSISHRFFPVCFLLAQLIQSNSYELNQDFGKNYQNFIGSCAPDKGLIVFGHELNEWELSNCYLFQPSLLFPSSLI